MPTHLIVVAFVANAYTFQTSSASSFLASGLQFPRFSNFSSLRSHGIRCAKQYTLTPETIETSMVTSASRAGRLQEAPFKGIPERLAAGFAASLEEGNERTCIACFDGRLELVTQPGSAFGCPKQLLYTLYPILKLFQRLQSSGTVDERFVISKCNFFTTTAMAGQVSPKHSTRCTEEIVASDPNDDSEDHVKGLSATSRAIITLSC